MYDGVRPLRRAEQVKKGRDPIERRLEIPLDATIHDRAFYRTIIHPSTLLTSHTGPYAPVTRRASDNPGQSPQRSRKAPSAPRASERKNRL
ncbi:hypothetical protein GCM10027203_28930 [Nonomuraea fastidiosa]